MVQVLKDYQQRLQAALASVRPSLSQLPSLPRAPTLPPAISAALPAFPSMPTVAALSHLPAFRDLNDMMSFEDLPPLGGTSRSGPAGVGCAQGAGDGASLHSRIPSFRTLADLSNLPAFRDLQSMDSFDDIMSSDAVSLRRWASESFAAAVTRLPDLRALRSSAADSVRASAAAARAALTSALPVLNLPDWSIAFRSGGDDSASGSAKAAQDHSSWQQRIAAASSAMLDQAERDGVFVRP